MSTIDLRCPKCTRYLGAVTTEMQGSVSVRIPSCPNCKQEVIQKIIVTRTTTS